MERRKNRSGSQYVIKGANYSAQRAWFVAMRGWHAQGPIRINIRFNIIYLMRTDVFVIVSLCWFCCAYYKRAPRHICFHPLSILHTEGTSMSPRFTQSAEGCERLVVVGLVADFGYQLAVQYLVVLVQHYHRTSSQ